MESSLESSLDLLKRVQAGDASALDVLIARYRPRLVRWASGRLPAHARHLAETQDLVQETLLRAFRKIGQIEVRDEGALQAYLRQVLLNTIRMELRRVRRRPAGSEVASDLQDEVEPSPIEKAVGRETLTRYEEALQSLRPAERELVIAHVEFGFDNQELATAFGKPTEVSPRTTGEAQPCVAQGARVPARKPMRTDGANSPRRPTSQSATMLGCPR